MTSRLSIFTLARRCAFDLSITSAQFLRINTSTRSFQRPFCQSRTMDSSTDPSKLVQFQGTDYQVIKEGRAHILNPPAQEAASKATRRDLKEEDESQSVFYNPIQQFNRDLSVLAIRAYGESLLESKKQKHKKRTQGKKRKREVDSEDQASKSATDGANEVKPEGEQTGNGKQEAQPDSEPSYTILDALSATGLRALRYASELPVSRVVANDLSASAIKSMKTNIEYNELQDRIQPNLGDARTYMYSLGALQKFDVIDLDPYGTASPFIDAAIQGVRDGGLLCVTCTDAGVWASTGYPEKAFSLYGGVSIKGSHSHEGGLRLILNSLAMSAAKYGLAIEPLLSLSIDFYARVFVRVYRSPALVKFTAGNTMLVYNCDSGCGAWSTQPIAATKQRLDKKGNPFYHYGLAQGPSAGTHCEHCGFKTHIAGPMWGGPLHNPHYIQKILAILPTLDPKTYQTIPRIEGMLTTALEEDLDLTPAVPKAGQQPTSEAETAETKSQDPECPAIIPRMNPAALEKYPFYFNLGFLSKVLHCTTIPMDEFRGAVRSCGYRTTRSHAKPNSIRTDAPWSVIWEIMREWVRQHSPIKESSIKPGTPGAAIMAKSRNNLRKVHEGDQWLAQLKRDLLNAVESGKDVSDLITKVEASLYRSGLQRALRPAAGSSEEELPDADAEPKPADIMKPPTSTRPFERPHPSTLDIKFDAALGREASDAHTKKRLVRYQLNPRANWGPLNRAAVASK